MKSRVIRQRWAEIDLGGFVVFGGGGCFSLVLPLLMKNIKGCQHVSDSAQKAATLPTMYMQILLQQDVADAQCLLGSKGSVENFRENKSVGKY